MTLLFAALLVAMPADKRLTMRTGAPLIERADAAVLSVEAEPPLRAELLASGELLLEAPQPGLFHVFLFSKRQVRAWEIAVGVPLPPAPPGGCTEVRDEATYEACRKIAGPQDRIRFELEGVQAEAKAAQGALAKAGLPGVQIALSAWGVKLKGPRDETEKRRALAVVWPFVLGPLRLDD